MTQFFKDYITKIIPYEPGRPIEEVARTLGLSKVIKLASNENPLGASPKAVSAIKRALSGIHLYPDGSSAALKEKLAKTFGLSSKQFVIGNGSNEIIELLARGFLAQGDRVVSSETSFLVYPLITQACGASYTAVPMKNFRFDLEGILDRIDRRTRLVFIANPNNPTGTYVKAHEVDSFLNRVPRDVVVCFDEAYIDFVGADDFPNLLARLARKTNHLILLRTFSKSHGLAGLRIGYGIASEPLIQYLEKIRQPFNVNRVAQAGALGALDDLDFLRRTQRLVAQGRRYLARAFTQINLYFVPSEANFILVNIRRNARQVFEALLRHGVIVRPMSAYGLETYIRVTIGKREELIRFVRALHDVLKKGVNRR